MARRWAPGITTALRTTVTPNQREFLYDTDEDRFYVSDGATAGALALAFKSETDALDLRTAARQFPVSQYGGDYQDAVDAAYAAGGGLVLGDDDVSVSSSVTLKDGVHIDLLPGSVTTWTGAAAPLFQSSSAGVLLRAGVTGYGATINLGASGTGALKLYGGWHCRFAGFKVTGTLQSSVILDLRGDSTGGSNPAGGRHTAFCKFADILQEGDCGTFLRMVGDNSVSGYITLNTFANLGAEGCWVRGVDAAKWADHNYFTGITRLEIKGNNSVGVEMNTDSPTSNVGVYAIDFDALAVDAFDTYTGRVGLKLNHCKDIRLWRFYQYPLAEGGAYSISSDCESHTIAHFNEALGKIQWLLKGVETAGSNSSGAVSVDVKNYDTGTSVAQFKAISGAATGATMTASAQAGISYIGNSSNHPVGIIANNVESLRFETSGAIQMKVAGASLLPQANDAGVLGSATVAWSDLFLASGAVLNFNNGDVTIAHSSNALTGAGGQLLWGYNGAAGTAPFQSTNSTDAQFNAAAIFRSARATPAANDAVYVDFQMSDSAGNATTMARLLAYGTTVTDGAEAGRLDILLAAAATPTAYYNITPTQFRPNANDGAALGAATLAWSDAFFASGAVVNFNNGDVTITHASNNLTVDGGDFTIASTFRINLNNSQTTVGAAGGASALPATPTGYIPIKVAGTEFVVPYYAKT